MRAHRFLQYSLHQGDDGQSTRSRLKARRRGFSIHHPDTHRSSVAGRIREHSLQSGRALRPASGRGRRTTHETFWRIRSLRGCWVPGICFLQSFRAVIGMMAVGAAAARTLAMVVLCIIQLPSRRAPFPVIAFFSENRLPSLVSLLSGRFAVASPDIVPERIFPGARSAGSDNHHSDWRRWRRADVRKPRVVHWCGRACSGLSVVRAVALCA